MNQTVSLNWGILGGARINERLLPALLAHDQSNLVAIASRRPGAAAETLARLAPGVSGITVYEGLEPLIEDPAVQAVYIPLANQEHAAWVLKAIEAGKHVLCEKPLALTPSDIDAIETAADRQSVKVMEGFMYRFHPQHQRVRALLESGLIGEIQSVSTHFSFMMRPARMYRLQEPAERGGGALWDIGCYAIHAARAWIQSRPTKVSAMARFLDNRADTGMSGVIEFEDGRHARFDFSFESTRRSEYEITGTLGVLRCPTVWQLPGDTPEIHWETEDGRRGFERLKPHNHFELEVEGFTRAVLENTPPLLSLEDAKLNCLTIRAALKSAESGHVVLI